MKKLLTTTLKLGFILVLLGAVYFAYDMNQKISEENNVQIEDQIMVTDSGVEVELVGDDTLKKKEVDRLLKDFEKLPEDLKSLCSKIIITNKSLDQIDPDANPELDGLASDTGTILLKNTVNAHTIRHEIMHLHDYFVRGDGICLSDSDDEFQQLANELMQKGSNKISTSSTREVYADCGAYYIAQDKTLETESKELYDYFDTKIFPGRFQ